jgi:hypothetical protein
MLAQHGNTAVVPDPRAAHHAIARRVQRFDSLEQALVVDRSSARLSRSPIVVAARRYAQTTTHHPDRKRVAATLDHAISHFDSFAKNAAASFKKSRSFYACSPDAINSLRHTPNNRGVIPSSLAICVIVTPATFLICTASCLNSLENFVLVATAHLRAHYRLF